MDENAEGHQPSDSRNDAGRKRQPDWEREVLTRLVFTTLNEQRRSRRWNIFFRVLFFAYLTFFVVALWPDGVGDHAAKGDKHTAVVELEGVISDATQASAEKVIGGLRDAFENQNTAGVILQINSPGGSPVQSGRINREMVRLKKEHPDIPLIAVIEDICASGGYYVAAASDKIYADQASLVGSIGVIMNGFGFVETLDKLGVERRLLTAGEHKAFLDPFSPVKEEEMSHVQGLLEDIHQQFIGVVKNGRGDRLQGGGELFSGLIWSGEEGVRLGLIDALGDVNFVAREVIGAEKIVDFTRQEGLLGRFSKSVGQSLGSMLHQMVRGTDFGLR